MRKIVLAGFALLFAASPVLTAVDASAQSRWHTERQLREERRELRDARRDVRRLERQLDRRDDRRHARPAWVRKGGRYAGGGVVVRDYRRYGLHAPGRGQHWVRVNNDYLLVAAVGGLIGAIIAGR